MPEECFELMPGQFTKTAPPRKTGNQQIKGAEFHSFFEYYQDAMDELRDYCRFNGKLACPVRESVGMSQTGLIHLLDYKLSDGSI